jgi:hypothetical protein
MILILNLPPKSFIPFKKSIFHINILSFLLKEYGMSHWHFQHKLGYKMDFPFEVEAHLSKPSPYRQKAIENSK